MSTTWQGERQAVADAARQMAALGLVTGTSGNVSARLSRGDDGLDLMAITPSGGRYEGLTVDDIVVTDFEVEPVEGERPPSTESLLHVAVYRARPEVGAVIHTHSVFSSALAVAGVEIPPVIDEVTIVIGGTVRVSRYAFPGSPQMADNVCAALDARKAALISNHGAVGVGRDLEDALEVCVLLERVAEIFVHASSIGGANQLPSEVTEAEQEIYRMRNPGSGGSI
jgi:L-fuculose-phosphate aldolase